jgi:hypothetical protein
MAVVSRQKGFAGDNGSAMGVVDTPGGIAIALNGDIYWRRLEQ